MTDKVVNFKSRRQIEAEEIVTAHHGCVIAAKMMIPDTGWKRPRWVVITVFMDGSNQWEDGPADGATALFVAGVRAKKFGFRVVNWGVLK